MLSSGGVHPSVDLPRRVASTFARAHAAGALQHHATQVKLLPVGQLWFQLRFAPSLAKKPVGSRGRPSGVPDPAVDPFANPPPELRIEADLGFAQSHYLVLNKFAIVPEHFILATRAFKSQTQLLEPDDLDACRTCIRAYRGQLFAFFNGGPHSGASQPHRHLQMLPVAQMRSGLEPGAPWEVLADRLDAGPVPFVVFSADMGPDSLSATQLHALYLRLYRQACRAVAAHCGTPLPDPAPAEGESLISYNLAMTDTKLVLCPRLAQSHPLSLSSTAAGELAFNGTLLAGSALVKSQAEWQALIEHPEQLVRALQAIGLPREDC